MPSSTLTLLVPDGFDFARAVCSYGYFLLAPNRWDPAAQRLHCRLRDQRGRAVDLCLWQSRPERITARSGRRLDRAGQHAVKAQVRRMLRMDEDLGDWFRLHPGARRAGFGRLFRSATIFEDVVKTITGCNVTWRNTITMNRLLCEYIGGGAFPTPAQLAAVEPDRLKALAKVGYRAERIIRLARDVDAGRLDLAWFEQPGRTDEEAYHALRQIHGIGDYAASNLCQLLGFYDRLPIDTETYRHFCHHHRVDRPSDPKSLHPRIEAHYSQYAPYRFLAYWFELWGDYQARFGDARRWDPAVDGANFTAANLK